jgi:hypothetical protein
LPACPGKQVEVLNLLLKFFGDGEQTSVSTVVLLRRYAPQLG